MSSVLFVCRNRKTVSRTTSRREEPFHPFIRSKQRHGASNPSPAGEHAETCVSTRTGGVSLMPFHQPAGCHGDGGPDLSVPVQRLQGEPGPGRKTSGVKLNPRKSQQTEVQSSATFWSFKANRRTNPGILLPVRKHTGYWLLRLGGIHDPCWFVWI